MYKSLLDEAKLRVERCVEEIDLWMRKNLLKLNQDKTELVVISSKFQNRPNLEYVRVGDEFIAPKLSVCNLRVIMGNCFCLEQHVQQQQDSQVSHPGLKFSSMLLSVLSLTTVTHFYMVLLNT